MTRPIIKIHNQETDEIIEREMNDAEFAQWEINLAASIAEKQAEEAKATQRQALLDKLGITSDEAKLLLS
jgi:hypothetical protein